MRKKIAISLLMVGLIVSLGCHKAEKSSRFLDRDHDGLNDRLNDPYPIPASDLTGAPEREVNVSPADYQRPDDDQYAVSQAEVDKAFASTTDEKVDRGDTAVIPTFEWVEVRNLEGVKSGNNEFPYGDTCSVKQGQLIEVKGIEGDSVLVEYQIPYQAYGALCPDGTLFLTTKEAFLSATGNYLRLAENRAEGKGKIARMLGQSSEAN